MGVPYRESQVKLYHLPYQFINCENSKNQYNQSIDKKPLNYAWFHGEEALKFAQKIWKSVTGSNYFERHLQQVVITSAGNGTCTAEFIVEEGFTNKYDTLHGGCTATLVDCLSSLGLMTTGDQKSGVSVSLCISYQGAAKLGTRIELHSKTVRLGKTMAYLDIILKEKETGKPIATGTHIKYMG